MPTPIVFFDIAGPDLAKQVAFFKNVFDWEIGTDGRFTTQVTVPLSGTLRQDPSDKVLYFGVPDINAALASIVANGGTVDVPRFEVKGLVVLGLFKDPAGNRLGLVEMDGDKAKVP